MWALYCHPGRFALWALCLRRGTVEFATPVTMKPHLMSAVRPRSAFYRPRRWSQELYKWLQTAQPVPRLGEPAEVAQARTV